MGVKTIGVFGSVIRGDDSPASDYDILVEFDEKYHNYKYFNQLCDFIEKHVGNNYDLVTRQGLSPYIGEKILQEVEYVEIAS
jgi:predicted nucleotidyltransferase